MVYQYKWAEGFTPKVDAEEVGRIFEELEEKDGIVTKENFLKYSRPKKSPTHCLFEWDDKVAAEKYRLATATKIIGHLRIEVIQNDDEEKVIVPAYVNIDSERDASYINITDAMSDCESKDLVMNRMKRDIDCLVTKYRFVEGFIDLIESALIEIKKGE